MINMSKVGLTAVAEIEAVGLTTDETAFDGRATIGVIADHAKC